MQDDQPQQTQKPALKFCLVQRPERIGWPIHGEFALFLPDGVKISHSCFSLAGGQDMLAFWVKQGEIDADVAADGERLIRESGLPHDLTRWDRIVRSFPDENMRRVLISRFCGTFPPKRNALARFQLCVNGEQCGLDNCEEYAPHGKLCLKGMDAAFGRLVFSPQAAQASFEEGLEAGVFTADDEQTIMQTAQAQLTKDESAQRADKLVVFAHEKEMAGLLGEELDYVFGLQQPEKPARFVPCSGNHVHLYIRDGRVFGTIIYTAHDAQVSLDDARNVGLLAQSDFDRLLADIERLKLPPGSPEESLAAQDQSRSSGALNVNVRFITGR